MDSVQRSFQLGPAYDCATEVIQCLRYQHFHFDRKSVSERQFILELAGVITDAIRCIQTDTKMSAKSLGRICKLVSADSSSQLLKLGYSLSVLLETLLADRIEDLPTEQVDVSATGEVPLFENVSVTDQAEMAKEIKEEDDLNVEKQVVLISVAPQLETTNPLYHETPREIKEEPLDDDEVNEIKIEAPAEFEEHVEVKEEPLEDVFCPTSDTSRALGLDEQVKMEEEPSTSHLPFYDEPIGHVWDLNETVMRAKGSRTITHRVPSSTDCFVMRHSVTPQPCSLCGQTNVQFFSTSGLDRAGRDKLLRAISTQSSQGMIRVAELQVSNDEAIFCSRHINPAKYTVTSPPRKRPISHDAPKPLPNILRKERTAQKLMIGAQISFQQKPRRECYLCGQITDSFCGTPVGRKERVQFFTILVNRAKLAGKVFDARRIDILCESNDKAYFCKAHFDAAPSKRAKFMKDPIPQEPLGLPRTNFVDSIAPLDASTDDEEAKPSTSSSTPMEKSKTFLTKRENEELELFERQFNQETRQGCYLCGETETNCVQLPIPRRQRATFLSRLIIRTDRDEKRVQELRTSDERALFCTTHLMNAQRLIDVVLPGMKRVVPKRENRSSNHFEQLCKKYNAL